jgi:predicted lipoprotein
VSATFYLSGCGEDVSSSQGEGFNQTRNTNTDFNQAQLITSLVDNVITPNYQSFAQLANEQINAIDQYCQQEQAALENNISTTVADEKLLAQDSWRLAMDNWQKN